MVAIGLAGCGTRGSAAQGSGAPAADPCGAAALGLAGATPLAVWTPPPGCAPTDGFGRPPEITSEAAFGAQLACPAGTASGVDFAVEALRATRQMLSPAGIGTRVFDDGKTLTYVAMQRPNCPDDPRPMPMEAPLVVRLAPGPRAIAERVCTVARTCP